MMKLISSSFWVILAAVAAAILSVRFVETPLYPVSDFHIGIVLILALSSWFYVSFSLLRKSAGTYACGVGFGFLTLAIGLLPDLWLRHPEASLLGLGMAQAGALTMFPLLKVQSGLRALSAVLLISLSVIPIAMTVYAPWPVAANQYVAGAGAVLLMLSAIAGWIQRQNRFTLSGLCSWIFFIVIGSFLLASCFRPILESNANRQLVEKYLLLSLMALVATFIADLLQIEQQLRSGPHMRLDASLKDALTNLANRRALELFGPQLISQSHDSGRAVSLIVADIDHFKSINDLNGHLAGDTVLRKTADRLAAQVRKSDLVARYGGEEFVVILPGAPLAPALRLAERMRAAVEAEKVQHDSLTLTRTVSFGVATAFPEEPTTLSELIERADQNLYRAKHAGRNKVLADELPTEMI